jgi:hypothetical protein
MPDDAAAATDTDDDEELDDGPALIDELALEQSSAFVLEVHLEEFFVGNWKSIDWDGTIAARPAEVFAEHEAGRLLPLSLPYDVPVFSRAKVHRDFHVEVGRALHSAPEEYLGCRLDARADSALVKLFHRGQLVKTHPRQQPGRRMTDPADLPAEKTTYAMRDQQRLRRRDRARRPDRS